MPRIGFKSDNNTVSNLDTMFLQLRIIRIIKAEFEELALIRTKNV
jgi:hypothetical protein